LRKSLLMLIAVALLLHLVSQLSIAWARNGLTIVVTFPFLYNDVKALTCGGDAVISLVKPGVDPHEYQLTPSDVNVIKEADLIISTGHAPFEVRIRDLVSSEQVRGKLVELPSIEGVTVLKHPQTGAPNYHGIQFYPQNYALLIETIKSAMEVLRPECVEVYEANAEKLLQDLSIINFTVNRPGKLLAVVDLPVLQYVATWLGLDVRRVLIKEEGVPITPQDYIEIERLLSLTKGAVVMVVRGSTAEEKLEDLAKRYGALFIALPNPLAYNGTLDYLKTVAQVVSNMSLATEPSSVKGFSISAALIIGVVIVVILIVSAVLYTWSRR